jgi:hypothetical protein
VTELERDASWIDRALRAGAAGAWRWALASDEISWSGCIPQALGFGDRPHDYAALLALVHEADRDELARELQRAKTEGARLVSEFRPAANPERWVELSTESLADASGTITQIVGCMHEITPRKHGEEVLVEIAERVSDAHGSDFLQSLDQGVLESNVDFLPRPLTPRRLAEKVRSILDAE